MLTALSSAVLICFCFAQLCFALEPLELHIEGVAAKEGELQIYCNTNLEETPKKGDFSITLGNALLPVKSVSEFASTDLGASYIFLVDVSGSIKQSQFNSIKETLAQISGKLLENDNVSIVDIGNETYTQPFVSGQENIEIQIDAINPRGENTNLYESIVKSLSILKTHESCRDKKILVVFSDGEEYSFRGITLDEAAIRINESHIPIYTVAMLGQNPAEQYIQTAKLLGSFARLSPGGKHYIHTLDNAAAGEIAEDITNSVKNSLVVTADLSDFRSDGNDMDLRLELTAFGIGRASGGYAIPTTGLSAPVAEPIEPEEAQPPPSSSAPAAPDIPGGTPPPDKPKPKAPVWIAIAAAVVSAAAAIVLIRRKKPSDSPPATVPKAPTPANTTIRPAILLPPPGKPRIALRLTKIGLVEEQVYRAEFAGTLVIGRDCAKDGLSFGEDDLLSSRHCSISYEPEGIVLRDLNSTNGTFVNGVPISERRVLENDDIMLIGSMELRVNWELLSRQR